LILTRQGLPILDRSVFPSASELRRGAYVLAQEKGTLDSILIATGSEVHIALEAWRALSNEGLGVRLVNMPSWEFFEVQDQDYKETVLPPRIKVRLCVEAASPIGWERYVGMEGDVIGISRFGSSAPGKIAMEKYGFTVENIVSRMKALLR
jgi:transketolase